MSYLSDEEIWTSGKWTCKNTILKLYNTKGKVFKSVQIKSEEMHEDIAVTRSGGLVYADPKDRSIDLVSGTQIETLITLRGWTPLCL